MAADTVSINDLKVFADVAQHGSFAETARRRDLDPSIVSRAIAGLEKSLGFRLFDRTTRRLNLTEAGSIYLERTKALVSDLDLAQQEAGDAIARPSGTIRITASNAFGAHWLTPRLETFMKKFPEICVDALFTDAVVDIASERIDLALRLTARPSGDLIAVKLMDTGYKVVASSEYVDRQGALKCPEELGERECLLLPFPGYRSRWTFRKEESVKNVDVHGHLTISSPAAIRAAALNGMGPALLADWMVQEDLKDGALIDLLPEWEATAAAFETAAWLLYPSRDYLPRKVRVLIDHLRGPIGK